MNLNFTESQNTSKLRLKGRNVGKHKDYVKKLSKSTVNNIGLSPTFTHRPHSLFHPAFSSIRRISHPRDFRLFTL